MVKHASARAHHSAAPDARSAFLMTGGRGGRWRLVREAAGRGDPGQGAAAGASGGRTGAERRGRSKFF
jgi:hypothetical protein